MAKKKKAAKNHLSSYQSFQFALNIAVLSVLISILLAMVGQLSLSTENRSQATPTTTQPAY